MFSSTYYNPYFSIGGWLTVGLFVLLCVVAAAVSLLYPMGQLTYSLLDPISGGRLSRFMSRLTPAPRTKGRLVLFSMVFLVLFILAYYAGGFALALYAGYWEGDVYVKTYAERPIHRTDHHQFLDRPFDTVQFVSYEPRFDVGDLVLYDREWAARQKKKYEAEGIPTTVLHHSEEIPKINGDRWAIVYDDGPQSIRLNTGRTGGFGDVNMRREFGIRAAFTSSPLPSASSCM